MRSVPFFFCNTSEFGPSGGWRGKRSKGYWAHRRVVLHEDLEDSLVMRCILMWQPASGTSTGILPFYGPLTHRTRVDLCDQWHTARVMVYHSWDEVSKEIAVPLSLFLSLSLSHDLLWEKPFWGQPYRGTHLMRAKPPANSHMSDLGSGFSPRQAFRWDCCPAGNLTATSLDTLSRNCPAQLLPHGWPAETVG